MGFSHISRQAVPGSRSPVSRVCQRRRKTLVPGTTSECRVTCYRVKRRYIKLSVFPAPIPVWRTSSRSHSTAVLPTLVSHTGVPHVLQSLSHPIGRDGPKPGQCIPEETSAPAPSREPVPELPALQAGQHGPSQRHSSC